MATRGRSPTSARSNPMWLTAGVNTQPVISEAGSAGTASRLPSEVSELLPLYRPVITGADGRWTSRTVFNSTLVF